MAIFEEKYKIEDVTMNKFIVGKSLDLIMIDSKSLKLSPRAPTHFSQNICWKMENCESFLVATVIEKLPPSWKDFKNYLKQNIKR